MTIRPATHAGSWYSQLPEELSEDLQFWLKEAEVIHAPARAIIAPHAGYSYSGACAGYAYKQIDPSLVKRVFILGPSHHKSLLSCALTKTHVYETPLYDLHVDVNVNTGLEITGEFEWMDLNTDQKEHSIEMQLPYIAKVMEGQNNDFTIVPILVGTLTPEQYKIFGKILSKYLSDPENLFVISSDFCHWGKKFNYTYYESNSTKPIYQCIEELDRLGMDAIESLNPNAFYNYMEKYSNTICGRNPIFVFLYTINEFLKRNIVKSASLKFVKYAQSQQCLTMDGASVSYAAASLVIK